MRNGRDICLEDIAPRVLTDDSTIIGTVVHSSCATPTFILTTEDLAAHQADTGALRTITAGDTRDTDIVVGTCADCPRHVCPMGFVIRVDRPIVMDEVEAIDIIDKSIVVIIDPFLSL